MARRGNGQLHGVGRGAPSKGSGFKAAKAPAFKPVNRAAAGQHDMSRSAQQQELLDKLFVPARTADCDATRVSAAVAWLNRYEGKPRTQSVQIYTSDFAALNDDELDREVERLRIVVNKYQ